MKCPNCGSIRFKELKDGSWKCYNPSCQRVFDVNEVTLK